ncbi:D-amino acid dehydrogenase small subunit [Caulifigura coniformis]|uniref:D-amino acid dehydrogenase small subunit n=1 Tax=Caulifigura coniformis TaxID=2527983 RepID=A0A517SAV9_9PLAN|nr:NAD(P)-binding protein [Caulifigura coniformis]QDT53267.1 D-amino acid dehydrogenase small subunit [Caulifigura coniformis]
MSLRVTNLCLSVEQSELELNDVVARQLRLKPGDLARLRILRKSLDARSRGDMKFVYTLEVEPRPGVTVTRKPGDCEVAQYQPEQFDDPPDGKAPLGQRPIVVGAGPGGLLAGYYLARRGYAPLILERGKPVKERVPAIRLFDSGGPHDPENNYLFGEGGAGAFSDGKLTCRMTGADVDWVLQSFVDCGGRPSLVYENRPHLGSNKLPMICRNYRRKIEALGGEYRFDCRVEGLRSQEGRIVGVETSSGFIAGNVVIFAPGHSARETYRWLLAAGVPIHQKAFQLGLRIEQPQEQVNRWKYGHERYLDLLGAADYSLGAKGDRDLYTFCMCAGGYVIPSVSDPGLFCSNGMSNSRHDSPFANSGLMVTLQPAEFGGEHPLAGVELQARYEKLAFELSRNYLAPIQWANDFVAGRRTASTDKLPSSYERGVIPADLHEVLPPAIAQAIARGLPQLDQKSRGMMLKNATLVGPEMRGSAPVRIERDAESRDTPGFTGFYPVGEGAGYAGGIVSAAVDGLRSAREIVRRYAPVTT